MIKIRVQMSQSGNMWEIYNKNIKKDPRNRSKKATNLIKRF